MPLHSKASVTYETFIIDANGRETSPRGPKKNLLLDSGLDFFATYSFWDSFKYCAVGTGTTPTKRDSGAITAAISGGVATASADFFEAGDVGRLLKIDNGQEVKITGYTSETQVLVAGASDDPGGEFTVWYVNEVGHGNEVDRTNNLGTDTGDVHSVVTATGIEHKRTFVFPVAAEAQTLTEIGWSPASSGGLLGRDLIPGAGDSLAPGQQYKVVVKLRIDLGDMTKRAVSDVAEGMDFTGECIITGSNQYNFLPGMFIGAEKSDVFFEYGDEGYGPSSSKTLQLIGSDFTLPATADLATYRPYRGFASKKVGGQPYTPGSHRRDWVFNIETTLGNGTIYGLGIGFEGDCEFWALKFDTPQTKASDHTLDVTFTQTWGRNLIN